MVSLVGVLVRDGRKDGCGAILRLRFVRAVVLWPREEMRGRKGRDDADNTDDETVLLENVVLRSWVVGRRSDREDSMVSDAGNCAQLDGKRVFDYIVARER